MCFKTVIDKVSLNATVETGASLHAVAGNVSLDTVISAISLDAAVGVVSLNAIATTIGFRAIVDYASVFNAIIDHCQPQHCRQCQQSRCCRRHQQFQHHCQPSMVLMLRSMSTVSMPLLTVVSLGAVVGTGSLDAVVNIDSFNAIVNCQQF